MDAVLLTPRGPGAIAVYLLAGSDCPRMLQQLSPGITAMNRGAVRKARIYDGQFPIDDALLLCLSDDLYELHLHGGVAVLQAVAAILQRLGAHVHDPQSDAARQLAARSCGIEQFRQGIPAEVLTALPVAKTMTAVNLLVHQRQDGLTAWRAHWLKQLALGTPLWQFQSDAQWLLDRSQQLQRTLTPPRIAIIGPPNAGKSTLANALLGKNVSITSETPGTTRDWVDAAGGLATPGPDIKVVPTPSSAVQNARKADEGAGTTIPAIFLDTAGIRHTTDTIENESIRRSKAILAQADAMIVVLDGTTPRNTDTDQFPHALAALSTLPPAVLAVNKSDRPPLPFQFPELAGLPRVAISAITHQGLPALIAAILQLLGLGTAPPHEPFAFTDRQRALLHRAAIAYNIPDAIDALTQL